MTGTKGSRTQHAKVRCVNTASQQNDGTSMFTRKPSVEKKSMQKIKGESINSTGSIAIDIQHPYLAFIQKRKRSYKKKLDKIITLEVACADGKV